MQVRSSGAALQIEHPHRVSGIVFKNCSGISSIVFKYGIQPGIDSILSRIRVFLKISLFVKCTKICFFSMYNDLACSEIDAAIQRRMDSTQIKD